MIIQIMVILMSYLWKQDSWLQEMSMQQYYNYYDVTHITLVEPEEFVLGVRLATRRDRTTGVK